MGWNSQDGGRGTLKGRSVKFCFRQVCAGFSGSEGRDPGPWPCPGCIASLGVCHLPCACVLRNAADAGIKMAASGAADSVSRSRQHVCTCRPCRTWHVWPCSRVGSCLMAPQPCRPLRLLRHARRGVTPLAITAATLAVYRRSGRCVAHLISMCIQVCGESCNFKVGALRHVVGRYCQFGIH